MIKYFPIRKFYPLIDLGANINGVRQKIISELGLTYHIESNSAELQTPRASYSTLGKVNLHISFNDGEKHKSIGPSEFIVFGPDWPGYYPGLVLGNPWLQKNNATIDMYNS